MNVGKNRGLERANHKILNTDNLLDFHTTALFFLHIPSPFTEVHIMAEKAVIVGMRQGAYVQGVGV